MRQLEQLLVMHEEINKIKKKQNIGIEIILNLKS